MLQLTGRQQTIPHFKGAVQRDLTGVTGKINRFFSFSGCPTGIFFQFFFHLPSLMLRTPLSGTVYYTKRWYFCFSCNLQESFLGVCQWLKLYKYWQLASCIVIIDIASWHMSRNLPTYCDPVEPTSVITF